MRFKRLRIILAIFLITFILIVGTILATGLHQQINPPIDKPKKLVIIDNTPTTTNSNRVTTSSQTTTQPAPTHTTTHSAPTHTVVTHTRRTRAS